ncbi:MAG: protease pro-enzyme activation domain-containing protein, partial [Thermoplasmatales archaeon]
MSPKIVLAVVIVAILAISSFGVVSAYPSGNSTVTLQQAQAPGFKNLGPINPNQVIQFEVFVPLRNTNLLSSDVVAISTPGSPMFDHFMTVSQVENLFTNAQLYKSVLSMLRAEGFNVELTAMNSVILASGTAGQVRNDLGINVNLFS